jgi:hypothetical protein
MFCNNSGPDGIQGDRMPPRFRTAKNVAGSEAIGAVDDHCHGPGWLADHQGL